MTHRYFRFETEARTDKKVFDMDAEQSWKNQTSSVRSTDPMDLVWGKSLEFFPVFTRREIDDHVRNCGKQKGRCISKTLVRGRKFKNERYLTSDNIYTTSTLSTFMAKCSCRASMKKINRTVVVHINRKSSAVVKATCNCPAGLSGYCNHVMAFLLELAEYSLNSLSTVPKEIACTSQLRKWGVPGNKETVKAPILKTSIHKSFDKKGISSTLYDPRLNFNVVNNRSSILRMKEKLRQVNKNIGFCHAIPEAFNVDSEMSKFGAQFIGSPLSYQLLPIERDFVVVSNLEKAAMKTSNTRDFCQLPFSFILYECNWELAGEEKEFVEKLMISNSDSIKLEANTRKQRDCQLWLETRKNRITSSNAHKIFIRKRDFEKLIPQVINKKNSTTGYLKEMLNHGIFNESIAKDKYVCVMNFRLNRNVQVRETGIVIQPSLPWLGASPDGIVIDNSHSPEIGLIDIKCPYTKRNSSPFDMIRDHTFYIGIEDEQVFLKKEHSAGYYTQIQLAMGLAGLRWCHFIVYVYRGMIIVKVEFDEQHFMKVVKSVETFYRDHFLKHIVNIQ